MHPKIRALLDLDDVNRQRELLAKQRRAREEALQAAEAAHQKLQEHADALLEEAHRSDALIRQYTQDIANCDERIEKLRGQQLEATSNKAYLTCINGIESAKSEKKVREESLALLREQIEGQQAKADEAKAKADEARAKVEEVKTENETHAEADTSEAELERLYEERKKEVDPKFLKIYERLVAAKHPRPLMQVDPRTRATPLGNRVSTNALESLRLGVLVTDPACNAILYVDEPEEQQVEKQ